jgi:hypothetical protein
MLQEKWTSRCGWFDEEWTEWFEKAIKDRQEEREFWEKAQERVVRERVVRPVDGKNDVMAGNDKGTFIGVPVTKAEKEKGKTMFKRLFRLGRVGK